MALLDVQQGNIPEKRNGLKFKKASRPLEEHEEEALLKASKYNRFEHPRINPVQGTLAYTFRDLEGGNEAVVEFLKRANVDNGNRSKFLQNFLIVWKNLDEFSQKRIDIFDCFCEKYDINKGKFFGVVQEGMFNHEEAMRQTSLSGYTPEFIDLVKRMAGEKRNAQDRALLAKMLKLDVEKPLVSIQDNSVKNELHVHTEKASVPSFLSSIKKGDEGIRKEVLEQRLMPQSHVQHKQLDEGSTEFIDAEIISETPEKVLVEKSEADFDYEMRKSAKNLFSNER